MTLRSKNTELFALLPPLITVSTHSYCPSSDASSELNVRVEVLEVLAIIILLLFMIGLPSLFQVKVTDKPGGTVAEVISEREVPGKTRLFGESRATLAGIRTAVRDSYKFCSNFCAMIILYKYTCTNVLLIIEAVIHVHMLLFLIG